MSTSDRGFFAPLSFDLRVRERMLGAGVVSATDIQQYLAGLQDHEGNCESLGIPQPALAAPQPPAPPPAPVRVAPAAPAAHTSSQARDLDDDEDDEDDDEDDEDEDDDDVIEAKPEEAAAAPVQGIAVGEPTPGESNDPAAVLEGTINADAAPAEEEAPKAEEGGAEASPQTNEEQAG